MDACIAHEPTDRSTVILNTTMNPDSVERSNVGLDIDPEEVPSLTDPRTTERTIVSFIRDVTNAAGADGVVVGLSGGIDSTVTATLAVEALHRSNVYGVLLPSAATRTANREDAKEVATSLGIPHRTVEIQPLVDAFERTVRDGQRELSDDRRSDRTRRVTASSIDRDGCEEALGNVAARIRMTVLYFEANTTSRLVLGTGNRTELLLGYFTKFGDGGVDMLPIGDLYKTEVRELGRHLGVPDRIIEKPPTAGLWAGQTDESELGAPYPAIDALLSRLIDDGDSPESVATSLGCDADLVDRFDEQVAASRHKRTSPPTPGTAQFSPPTEDS